MARVFVDVSIVSQDWFKARVLTELVQNRAVRFTYSKFGKLAEEHENAKRFGLLMKRLSDQGRTDNVSAESSDVHVEKLTSLKNWQDEGACDDPHIFALIYEKPTKYVFSADQRIARCRDCINKVVENRYCDFILITREATYIEHKQNILK